MLTRINRMGLDEFVQATRNALIPLRVMHFSTDAFVQDVTAACQELKNIKALLAIKTKHVRLEHRQKISHRSVGLEVFNGIMTLAGGRRIRAGYGMRTMTRDENAALIRPYQDLSLMIDEALLILKQSGLTAKRDQVPPVYPVTCVLPNAIQPGDAPQPVRELAYVPLEQPEPVKKLAVPGYSFYYVYESAEVRGPFLANDLLHRLMDNTLALDALVCKEGEQAWVAFSTLLVE